MKYDEIPQDILDNKVIINAGTDTSTEIFEKVIEIKNNVHVFGCCAWEIKGEGIEDFEKVINDLVEL